MSHDKVIAAVHEMPRSEAKRIADRIAEDRIVLLDSSSEAEIESGRQGAIGETAVALDLMRRGYEVFRPLNPQATCDLLALKEGTCIRVECKVSRLSISGSLYRDVRDKTDKFDLLAIITPSGKIIYRDHIHAIGKPQKARFEWVEESGTKGEMPVSD
jgi:predicted AAA+ superfamily ATPase